MSLQFPTDWPTRLAYGALGGLTLVLVRAVQLGFFIGVPAKTALAGWLTLASFSVIALIGALVTDEKKAFKVYVAGLGTPSLAVAFLSGSVQFHSPAAASQPSQSEPIPLLSLFLPVLHAAGQPPSIEILPDMEGGNIRDGLTASITGQRPPDRSQYLYVVGWTTDEGIAEDTAEQLIRDLELAYQQVQQSPPSVHLLRAATGRGGIFVSVGYVQST